MTQNDHRQWKLAVHGAAVEVECAIESLHEPLALMLDPFREPEWPQGFTPAAGVVLPYDQAQVLRHLSPTARKLQRTNDLVEIYNHDERFWIIDDRWGISEINVIKGQWRSWVLPNPRTDPWRCAEMAVLWPMAQVLRARAVYLVPAASVVRDGWATLIISPFSIEPELSALIRDGYRIIGQRWTALREEDGRLALLHMPGRVERSLGPRLRTPLTENERWVDLRREFRGAGQNHAFCDSVLIVEPGRRPRAHLRCLEPGLALQTLRRAWPITELHPQRRFGQLPMKLSTIGACAQVQLSRNPNDLLALLHSFREAPPQPANQHVTPLRSAADVEQQERAAMAA